MVDVAARVVANAKMRANHQADARQAAAGRGRPDPLVSAARRSRGKQPRELFEFSGSRDDFTREQIPGRARREDFLTARLKEATLELGPVVVAAQGTRRRPPQRDLGHSPVDREAVIDQLRAVLPIFDARVRAREEGIASTNSFSIALEVGGLIGLGKATGEAPLCVSFFTVH
jgi:hypothetical protein